MKTIVPFNVDAALDSIDLTFSKYTPSIEAFEFFNIVRLFYGKDFEIPNPKFHYFLVDSLYGNVKAEDFPYSDAICETITVDPTQIGVIASRGSAKSTITTLFYPIVAAVKGTLPVTGPLSHILILSDSQQGGARDQALLMGKTFDKSAFAKQHFEKIRYTESEVEVVRRGSEPIEKRHMLVKYKGAQSLALDETLFTDTGTTTMGAVQVGDRIFGACGNLCTVTEKSEVFYKDMYELVLKDGRKLRVSEDHINSVMYKTGGKYTDLNVITSDLLANYPLWYTNPSTGYRTPRLWIRNIEALEYGHKEFLVDPYTLGLWLGDGYYHSGDCSAKLTAGLDDFDFYEKNIPYSIGYKDVQGNCVTGTVKGLGPHLRKLGLDKCKAPDKFIPEEYLYGSKSQRLALLRGLIDTDGMVREGNKGYEFMSTSPKLVQGVIDLVRSLGGIAYVSRTCNREGRNFPLVRVAIKLNEVAVKVPRKAVKASTSLRASKVAVVAINKIATVPSQCIAIDNESRQYVAGNYVRTHNTGGIRSGSRNPVTEDRYALVIADDVIKNEAEAYSETIMHNVKTALESDARNAMRAKKTQFVVINTPFHVNDPIYKMVESGAVTPIVAPICKDVTAPREEFQPLWEDMHDYDSITARYRTAVAGKTTKMFNQELMLRVSNEEDRLVTDDMIQWYDRKLLVKMLDAYSLVITTDFTTTSSIKSDFSGGAVWAVSSNYDYFLLDLFLKKQELEDQYNSVFRLVFTWNQGGRAIDVGVEIDGQQKAHIFALKQKMTMTGRFFSFARQKGAPAGKEGITSKSSGSKHERFRHMLPNFQNHKIYFPAELKDTPEMKEALKQLEGATTTGFSRNDDFCDLVSQLGLIDLIPGSGESNGLVPEFAVMGGEDLFFMDGDEYANQGSNLVF